MDASSLGAGNGKDLGTTSGFVPSHVVVQSPGRSIKSSKLPFCLFSKSAPLHHRFVPARQPARSLDPMTGAMKWSELVGLADVLSIVD